MLRDLNKEADSKANEAMALGEGIEGRGGLQGICPHPLNGALTQSNGLRRRNIEGRAGLQGICPHPLNGALT